jgi:hypothetical protein
VKTKTFTHMIHVIVCFVGGALCVVCELKGKSCAGCFSFVVTGDTVGSRVKRTFTHVMFSILWCVKGKEGRGVVMGVFRW